METIIIAIITAIAGVIGSNGIWSYIAQKNKNDDIEKKALKGLLHNRICELCEKYIVRGDIFEWEYDDLLNYIFIPYKTMGGNGTAEKLIEEVKKLPMLMSDEKGESNGKV